MSDIFNPYAGAGSSTSAINTGGYQTVTPGVAAPNPQAAPAASTYGLWQRALPGIATGLQAGGALAAGISESNALRANAGSYRAEAGIATRQGFEQEAQQRRASAMALGRETAAVGQAGGGYGGSAGRAVAQSARNMELDALNIRYKSQLQGWSYLAQAGNLQYEARQAAIGGGLKAGAALLRGYSGNYTGVY